MAQDFLKHLDKNNLHHAYLIEGEREQITAEISKFLETCGVQTSNNPDFCSITVDTFKIDDARNLKSLALEKGSAAGKKIFIISVNSLLLEAQNTLLKIFEEPIQDTHFFIIVPDTKPLLKTLISRFYVIRIQSNVETKEAEKFIQMPLSRRIDFIKELLVELEEEEESAPTTSTRSKSIEFLNALEAALHSKIIKNFSGFTLPGVPGGTYTAKNSLQFCFSHIFKVRKFLRQPGSSAKTLMESVALIVPMI